MKNETNKKNYNSKTITLKTDSEYSFSEFTRTHSNYSFSEVETILKHDALDILLNSPNLHRNEYKFTDKDFEEIKKLKIAFSNILIDMKFLLKNKTKK